MKYMQAHLVNMMNDETCDQNQVGEEWEKGCNDYHDRLVEIEGRLPLAAQTFVRDYCLHDGLLSDNVRWDHPERLTLVVRTFQAALELGVFSDASKEKPKQDLVMLEYDLECPVERDLHHGPGFSPDDARFWLYDEFDVDEQGRFVHSILFSSGLEVKVTFKRFTWLRAHIEEEH